jgi:alanyl-tRNA synthetase
MMGKRHSVSTCLLVVAARAALHVIARAPHGARSRADAPAYDRRMPLPTSDTTVTYPDGAIRSTGTVLHVEPLVDGSSAVILDTTAFHPVDTAWPDQPADRGTLTMSRGTLPIVDGVTGGIHAGVLHLGSDLPVRSGTEGWIFVVAHIVEGEPPAVGESVRIDVDAEYRAALSAAHTACHLASLALDAALAEAWTKSVSTDALGNPAFDALAIQRSQIHPLGSTDTYRIGKSLRRRGFTLDALDDPTAVAARIDAQLDRWISAGGPVRIERDDEGISSRRTWVCELPEGRTGIWCGGTHVSGLEQLARVTTTLDTAVVDGGVELVMESRVTLR